MKVSEKQYKAMPAELQALFRKCPNPGSDEVVGLFPVTTSGQPMNKMHTDPGRNVASGASKGGEYFHSGYGDTGSAARFFQVCPPDDARSIIYTAKGTARNAARCFKSSKPKSASVNVAQGGAWVKVSEKQYKAMPAELQALFRKCPNPGSDEVREVFPDVKAGVAVRHRSGGKNCHSDTDKPPMDDLGYGDSGSAARFFKECPPDDARSIIYTAKASKRDRDEGCEGLEAKKRGQEYGLNAGGTAPQQTQHKHEPQRNHHPTVKPTSLMRYLCRLITPPGGVVLDPFCGSGSTGKGAVLEGFRFIGIEREPEYVEIARARIAHTMKQVEGKDQEQEKLF